MVTFPFVSIEIHAVSGTPMDSAVAALIIPEEVLPIAGI
jgi:hypothetical protein